MEFKNEIAQLIDTLGAGTFGTDIFISNLPDTTTNGIMLKTGASIEPDKYLEIYSTVIDFWARNQNYEAGREQLHKVFEALHRRANYSTENYHVYFSHALGTIEDLDRDINNAKLFKLSIKFIYYKISNN